MRLATILISGLFAATAAAQCNYDVIGLPEYPCGQSIGSAAPSDMNNEGVIVGWWQQCNGEDHAIYYWSPKGGLHPEFFLPPTAHTAEAIAINDKGNFTGSARDGLNKAFGWAWIDGAYQIINIPPGMGNAIEPVGINNHDEIVGWLGTPPLGERSAFRWKDGVLTILDVDSTNAGAFDINDNGQIAGLYVAGGPAFLLEGDRLTSLPALPDATSHRVRRINEHGVIVGRTSIVDPEISFTATRWCDGEVTDLGVLPGSDYSVAVGINRFGTIVAQGADDWILVNDSITPLAELADGFDGTMWDINDDGWIIATDGHPFLLTPANRPAADINVDCHVDAADLSIVLWDWGLRDSPADVDHDGVVGPADLAVLLSEWSR